MQEVDAVQTFLLQSELTNRLERTIVLYSTHIFERERKIEVQSYVMNKFMYRCP